MLAFCAAKDTAGPALHLLGGHPRDPPTPRVRLNTSHAARPSGPCRHGPTPVGPGHRDARRVRPAGSHECAHIPTSCIRLKMSDFCSVGENHRSGVEYKKYQRSPSWDGQSSESGRRRVLTTEKTGCHRSFFISRGHPTSAYAPSTSRKRTGRNGRCWPSRPGHEELH